MMIALLYSCTQVHISETGNDHGKIAQRSLHHESLSTTEPLQWLSYPTVIFSGRLLCHERERFHRLLTLARVALLMQALNEVAMAIEEAWQGQQSKSGISPSMPWDTW